MSMESLCTIGAMASKNASASSPESSRIASASGAEVRGPVATMTLLQSDGGRPPISPRLISISGGPCRALVTAAEKPSRSTARAPPAGTWLASAARMISEPKRRISACSSPTALLAASSERNELEHTSSARPSVRCASVMRSGRISCSTTGMPAPATCQAASEPARPAPTICTGGNGVWVPVMGTGVARFRTQWNAKGSSIEALQIPQRPQQSGRYPFVSRHRSESAVIGTGCNARNVRAIKADIGQLAIAELGQFADIALIVPEGLDHADEREKHGSLLVVTIQLLEESLIVEMNIGQYTALQKFRCCGAANLKTHSEGKDRLTFRHGCPIGHPRQRPSIKITRMHPEK